MTKSYKVAGHTFSVDIPEGHPLWDAMGNYEPFEVELCEDPIFTLHLSRDLGDLSGRTLVYSGDCEEKDQPRVDLYRQGENWIFDLAPVQYVPICGQVRVSADYTEGWLKYLEPKAGIATFSLNNALMLMYSFRTGTLKTLEMHASVIVNGGKGYLFLGKSGTGKSTHSSLWLKYIEGSRLLNDDNPIVRVEQDGTIMVYGSPWSGKTPCYINDSAPVGAFVKITQYPENIIHQLPIVEAYAIIHSSTSGFKGDRKMSDGLYESTAAVVTGVPCYELQCLPDEAAALLSSSTVRK